MANLRKILLVDDDDDLREALSEQLVMTEDFDVFEAATGQEGMEKAKAAHYDLVILDVEMPHLTGPEMAYRMFLHDAGLENVPVVLVSGALGLTEIAERAGIPYVLAKPFDLPVFLALVERALSERRPPAPHHGAPRP